MAEARGLKINNVLSIRKSADKWQGLAADQSVDPAFFNWKSIQFCLRAGARILLTYKADGINTIGEAIAKWAPPSDGNDTGSYAAFVATSAARGVNEVVDFDTVAVMLPVLKAIAIRETGFQATDAFFMQALAMAGIADSKPPALFTSKQFLATAGGVAATGAASATSLKGVVDQTIQNVTPYAAQNEHVAHVVAVLCGVAAACGAAGLLFQVIHRKAVGV